MDPIKNTIVGFNITNQGSNYSKPKVVIIDGGGSGYSFKPFVLNGKVKKIDVINGGYGYTRTPLIKIIESDLKIYFTSKNIGVPQNVKIIQNGFSFTSDNTVLPEIKSNTTFLLKDFNENAFSAGEEIYQPSSNARARVSRNGWRVGSNLLKVDNIVGIFDNNQQINGKAGRNTATLVAQISTKFNPEIKSYYDNIGYYASDRGKLSTNSQKLTDSYFYQDYSYVVKSKTPIDVWRELIKETTHPAGFQLFGEVLIETSAQNSMPTNQKIIETYSCITLPPINLEVVSTTKYITSTTLTAVNSRIERGTGSISVDTFDSSETIARQIILSQPFNGVFDPDTGKVVGDREFTLVDKKTNLPISVSNPQQLIISLDGVIQEPGVSFVISGTTISFSQPPLGPRIEEGQEVEAQEFYGKVIKFKSSVLNNRYFKKLKNISKQFDGKQTVFNLYYTNGSIVKTDPNENLLVFLNGVFQKAKINANTPYGNSYYISRSDNELETDKIIFSSPPINHDDNQENLPSQINGAEKCFIYSIGSYERLRIDPTLIQYRKQGPYLIVDEVKNTVRKIDDQLYAFVFIDGVLQQQGKAYDIIGPSIKFTSSLVKYTTESGEEIYQDVSIILFYGRDIEKTLTFYDYEPDTFYNKINLTLAGTGVWNSFDTLTNQWSGHKPEFYTQKVHVYQDNYLIGDLKRIDKINANQISLTILTPFNLQDLSQENLTFVVNDTVYLDLVSSYQISYVYTLDDDGQRILTKGKSEPIWLFGSELGDAIETYRKTRSIKKLVVGDKIRIDGEKEYRQILSIQETTKQKNYNKGELITSDYYNKIGATNYNDITRGEGLSINATLDQNGTVVSLEWNKRDLELYFSDNVLLQPTAYQYYTPPIIEFLPMDENGGGARAEIVTYGGQVLDVVLLDGGIGYTEPPKVVIARGYDKLVQNTRKVDSLTSFTISPQILPTVSFVSSNISYFLAGQQPNITSIVSFGATFGEKTTDREIVEIITPEAKESKVSIAKIGLVNLFYSSDIVKNAQTTISPNITPKITSQLRTTVEVSPITTSRECNTIITSGLFDYPASETTRYGLANAGYNIGTFDRNSLTGNGSSLVSGFTIEEFDLWYSNVTIEEFEIRKLSHYFVGGEIFDVVTPSVQEFGCYLDAPLSSGDTIVYATTTAIFPSAGLLLVGKEIIRYTSKTLDRFTGITRGYLNSPIESHDAGYYLRTIEIADLPLDYVLDPGPG
jgi:hypothetical protein